MALSKGGSGHPPLPNFRFLSRATSSGQRSSTEPQGPATQSMQSRPEVRDVASIAGRAKLMQGVHQSASFSFIGLFPLLRREMGSRCLRGLPLALFWAWLAGHQRCSVADHDYGHSDGAPSFTALASAPGIQETFCTSARGRFGIGVEYSSCAPWPTLTGCAIGSLRCRRRRRFAVFKHGHPRLHADSLSMRIVQRESAGSRPTRSHNATLTDSSGPAIR